MSRRKSDSSDSSSTDGGANSIDWKQTRPEVETDTKDILKVLKVRDPLVAAAVPPDRRFQSTLSDAARASADLVDDCGTVLQRYAPPGTILDGDTIRAKEEYVRELDGAQAKVQATADAIKLEATASGGELSQNTGAIADVASAITEGTIGTPEEREQVTQAGLPLAEVIAGKSQARSQSRKANKATTETLGAAQQQTLASQQQVAQLQLEKNYLQGQTLTPQDLNSVATVAAAAEPVAAGKAASRKATGRKAGTRSKPR